MTNGARLAVTVTQTELDAVKTAMDFQCWMDRAEEDRAEEDHSERVGHGFPMLD